MNRAHSRILGLAAIVAALMLVTGLMTGVGSRASAHGDEAHPAHLHLGTCAEPGEVVFPLSNVSAAFEKDGTATAGADMVGQASAIPVDISVTTVQAALADIVSGGHALVVHESADAIQNYIACGDVGGYMMGESDLAIGLGELSESGYSGVATLHDNGDGTTTVSVYLTAHEEAAGDEGGDEGAATDGAAIEIKDFSFNPPSLEIAAGTTVTWTNNDGAPHTVTQDGGGFQSGKIDSGASFSFTFDTPGTYAYHCEFHPNMTGEIIVK